MNGHRSDIKRRVPDKLVATHFNSMNHSVDNLTVTVIDRLYKQDTVIRKLREDWWINTLTPSLQMDSTLEQTIHTCITNQSHTHPYHFIHNFTFDTPSDPFTPSVIGCSFMVSTLTPFLLAFLITHPNTLHIPVHKHQTV